EDPKDRDDKTDNPEDPKDQDDKADKPEEDAAPMEIVNLNNVEMKQIVKFLTDWTGKVIIPDPKAMSVKITIYAKEKRPRKEALSLIYAALQVQGYVADETDTIIYIKPLADVKTLSRIPTLSAAENLATIEDKNMVVQKFFKLQYHSPEKLQKILKPLVATYGDVSTDEATKQVVVIETVSNLQRIQRIIEQFDTDQEDQTVQKTIKIHDGDPEEIAKLLEIILSDGKVTDSRSGSNARGYQGSRYNSYNYYDRYRSRGYSPPRTPMSTPSTITINTVKTRAPITLIPEPVRKWIIVKAAKEDFANIEDWIARLDKKQPVDNDIELRKLEFADPEEVAEQVSSMLYSLPGQNLQGKVMIHSLNEARQIMIVGGQEHRELIAKLIAEIDVPADKFITEHFDLQYADPEQIKTYIEELFSESNNNRYSYYDYYGSRNRGADDEMVRVIAYNTHKKITVIANAENMVKVKKQIDQWDKPIDVDEVAPCIIELKNSDPVKMANLLSELFSDTSGSNDRSNMFDYFLGRRSGGRQSREQIVGPLYGQLTFKPVPDTKKIIVISKIPEAYEVVEKLIEKLDKKELAETPLVVKLDYADCEDLCEQLNAMFSDAGTPATIRRRTRTLTDYETAKEGGTNSNRPEANTGNNNAYNPATISGPWAQAPNRSGQEMQEMPVSNLIGRIRFIPSSRSKAILVLAPEEFHESLKTMIQELDEPVKQVMIKAFIVEINHDDLTSLGTKLATDPAALGAVGENAIASLTALAYEESVGQTFTISAGLDINTLVDFLVKNTNGRIVNEPTLCTKDNEEALFRDGQTVPLIEGEYTSSEGGRDSRNFKYEEVGVMLQVLPSITPENAVDMTVFLEISQVNPDRIDGNIAISEFKTNTKLIVNDGETLMLSGILFENDTVINHKVPLLGDIPLLGELFKHKEVQKTNSELLAFITPYVIDNNPEKTSPETIAAMESALEKMKQIQAQLGTINYTGQDEQEPSK
ncbi:MAG: hypothetical protein K9M57_04995, partial [Phycisphaerae bacterium]|nr:hypothetical protein [Phycisphaerae bacterium]